MKKEIIIKMLIPLIAVVVVVESIVLVSNLDKKTLTVDSVPLETENISKVEEPNQSAIDFVFKTENKEMKIGKPYEVSLSMIGKKDVDLDGMEIYIKYDPIKVEISKLNVDSNLPKLDRLTKIDNKEGLVSSVMLWDAGKKYSIKTDESNSILSFVVTPKIKGETEISMLGDAEGNKYSTLLVESVTSNKLLFLSDKLEINAVN
jgi:hypothetical protein